MIVAGAIAPQRQMWNPATRVVRTELTTFARMVSDQIGYTGPIESQEEMVARYQNDL